MIFNINNFPYDYLSSVDLVTKPRGNQAGKTKRLYKDIVCAFDIETTRIVEIEQAVMYVWQFQLGNDFTIIGRTWDEYLTFLYRLTDRLDKGEYLVVYVHNLSFEFQFLAGIYHFMPEEVFALEARRILKCSMYDHIEYRCSYIHSNMSLAKFTEKMGVENSKLSGEEFDYNKPRYWFTPLTDRELQYCINDVKGLVQAIYKELELDGDTLYTIPLTSTGYVRRDVKLAMRQCSRSFILDQLPTWEVYEMLREAFRGGDTHANRFFSGRMLYNVKSADRSSSYPETQCNRMFPVSQFFVVRDEVSADDLIHIIDVRQKAVVMRIQFVGLRLRRYDWGAPYLSRDKCRNLIRPQIDNGRVLSCDLCETTITDVDFRIIVEQYEFDDCIPIKVAYARYGMLPKQLTQCIINYYKLKTDLKDVDGQEYYYMRLKNKINAIYGMTAQDPVKETILFKDGKYETDDSKKAEDILKESNRKAFIPYQWGVWCTAWARYELQQGIKLAHGENSYFVYCDTDSVKYIGDIDWTVYNKDKVKMSSLTGACATDRKGTTHYMGVFEQEKTCARFKTYGAKKYACTYDLGDKESDVIITVAGVPKKRGAIELQEHGGIDAFKTGFIFNAGKMETVYNDQPDITSWRVDNIDIPITRNVVLRPTTYRLSVTQEYDDLIQDERLYKKMLTRFQNQCYITL